MGNSQIMSGDYFNYLPSIRHKLPTCHHMCLHEMGEHQLGTMQDRLGRPEKKSQYFSYMKLL